MDGQQIMSIVIASLVTGCITVGLIAQAWAARRRGDGASPASLDALERRLERMEQTIDAIALEMERVGEANRFTARLLAERLEQGRVAASPARVITPH
jgi:hypothetical protein